jgi:hypothetical protein
MLSFSDILVTTKKLKCFVLVPDRVFICTFIDSEILIQMKLKFIRLQLL